MTRRGGGMPAKNQSLVLTFLITRTHLLRLARFHAIDEQERIPMRDVPQDLADAPPVPGCVVVVKIALAGLGFRSRPRAGGRKTARATGSPESRANRSPHPAWTPAAPQTPADPVTTANAGIPRSGGARRYNPLFLHRAGQPHENPRSDQARRRLQRQGPREARRVGRGHGEREDVDESVRRDRGRGGGAPEGKGRGDGSRGRFLRRRGLPGNAAHRARAGRRPRDPGRNGRRTAAVGRRQAACARWWTRKSPTS